MYLFPDTGEDGLRAANRQAEVPTELYQLVQARAAGDEWRQAQGKPGRKI